MKKQINALVILLSVFILPCTSSAQVLSLNGLDGNTKITANNGLTIKNISAKNQIQISGPPRPTVGYGVLAIGDDYAYEIPIIRKPTKVIVTIDSFPRYSKAEWNDPDKDGFGVCTIVYIDNNGQSKVWLSDNTTKIGRNQTGESDAQDWNLNFSTINILRIEKGDTYGTPTIGNILQFTYEIIY